MKKFFLNFELELTFWNLNYVCTVVPVPLGRYQYILYVVCFEKVAITNESHETEGGRSELYV